MKTITVEWLKAAESDLLLIGEILHNEVLTHLAAFHAEQAIEKCLKAICEEYDEVPKIHNLKTLLKNVKNLGFFIDVDIKTIEQLDMLYIDSRYPGEFGFLPNGKPTVETVKEFYDTASKTYADVKLFLESQDKGGAK